MRIRVVFVVQNKGATVPFHHQYLLAQYIRSLVQSSHEYSENCPFYNFSGIKGQTKVSRNGLHFYSSKVTLVLASRSQTWIDFIIQKIFQQKEIKIGNLLLTPELVEQEIHHHLEDNVKYMCISPLVLCKPQDDTTYQAKKFIAPDLDVFSDLLYEATIERMAQTNEYSEEELISFSKFQLVPDEFYLKKIKEDQKKFARIYTLSDEKKQEVRGYTLPFTLYAPEKVQQFVLNCGLGTFSEEGYGMIDLVRPQGSTQRVEHYFKP
ncbi:MAG: CRISPR-associated protein Cas6 [Cytophagia bacterium]|nr:MAG: CRISPR-associated protein Cas6 [Cytophagia bacterium]TAH28288.1 MAG: CRISPR-associated protein Cas6 [Cytophagales bacterium]